MRNEIGFVTLFFLAISIGPAKWASASIMTGAYVVSTQADGNNTTTGMGSWDTVASNGMWNIWLNDGGLGGPFINGPDDANVGLNYLLTPGVHDFTFQFRGGDIGVTYFGLNLFLDGNGLAPGISTFGQINTTAAGNQPFWVNSASQTPALDGTVVPGAGTLTYVNGPQTVTLTNFQIFLPGVFNQDRIGAFSTAPDFNSNDPSTREFVGQFSLTVVGEMPATVPEPASLAIWGIATACLVATGLNRGRLVRGVGNIS